MVLANYLNCLTIDTMMALKCNDLYALLSADRKLTCSKGMHNKIISTMKGAGDQTWVVQRTR